MSMDCSIPIDRGVHCSSTPTLWGGIRVALEWHRGASQICKSTPQRRFKVVLKCTVRVASQW